MNQVATYDPDTGEIAAQRVAPDSLVSQLARVEIDSQIATARAFPRSEAKAMKKILSLVTISQASAEKCNYALPRGGKPITGPSIRLAEIVFSQWGNCRVTARVVEVDRFKKVLKAEGTFHDLETNSALKVEVDRRISDKAGRLLSDDMIVVTGNAACSIARRNAILAGIPEAIWGEAYQTALATIKGDVKTLPERRDGAFKAFAAFGVTPDQIVAYLELGGIEDINLDHLATLIAIHGALKSGEQQIEDYFPAIKAAGAKVKDDAPKGTAAKLADIAKGGDKAKTEDKPADTTGPTQAEKDHQAAEANRADDAARQAMQDARDADAKDKAEGNPEDAATAAYTRGRKAHARGMKADACPPDLRKDDALAEAWMNGWKDADAEAEGGEG